jgi:hypothetical protein
MSVRLGDVVSVRQIPGREIWESYPHLPYWWYS